MNESSNKFVINIITFTVLIILVISFWQLRNGEVQKIIKERQSEIYSEISVKIKKEFRLDNGKPFIIYPKKDSVLSKSEILKIQNEIGKLLNYDHTQLNDSILNSKKYSPFFVFPKTSDSERLISLTESDLERIKEHFLFIRSELDDKIAEANDNLNLALQNLDFKLSIWIGVLGLLGIFIPIFLQFQTTNSTEKIIEQKVSSVQKGHVELIDKLSDMSKSVGELSEQYEGVAQKAESASTVAEDSKKQVLVIHNLGKLRNLDLNRTQFVKDKKNYFIIELEKIANALNPFLEYEFDDLDFVINDIRDFFYTMSSFKFYFSEREFTKNIDMFNVKLRKMLDEKDSKFDLKELVDELSKLIVELKK